jgi:cyclic pyranopterin phosphate synthase
MNRLPLPLAHLRGPLTGPLIDTWGRRHNNLRISVTDRCNLRCTYCMPEEVVFRPRHELLTFEEITHFVRVARTLGIDKVRLTGGEPLLRRGLSDLVAQLLAVPGLRDVSLTTNGLLLAQQAADLHAAGLRRLNVSLDTLDEARFRQIARRPGLANVLTGLATARAVGLAIKVNAIAMRGVNDADIVPLAHFCRTHGFELRFIEYMPIGAEAWERDRVWPADELLALLAAEVGALVPVVPDDPHAPATDYAYADGQGRVGVIASVSRPFCTACNRVRLTAEGKLRNCLFAREEVDVRPFLRDQPDDVALAQAIRANVWAKWAGHDFNTADFVKPERTMHAIGG